VTKSSALLRGFLKAMFSDYNGIQVFLYPGTIFYWISSTSILWALSTLLSVRLHFLPISFMGILVIYISFIMMKIYTILYQGPHRDNPHLLSEYWDAIIRLHTRLFVVLLAAMIFFVFTEFMAYFYGIKIPLKQGIMLFFRLFTILLIIAYYIPAMWLKPYRKRRYGKRRSELLCYSWITKNPLQAVKYSGMLFLVMLAAVRIYVIVIAYIYNPLLFALNDFLGINLHVELMPISNIWTVFYNLFMLAVAFMLSNLCFFPIIKLAQLLADALHPIKLVKVNHAQS
jgi:hypothetical protein